MLVFPNCKINLGLNITQKREDGFHNIETVFYPVNWCDALEVIELQGNEPAFAFSHTGLQIDGKLEDNLVYKAWKLMAEIKPVPPIKVHLHKTLPMGAGLGGGSANAAFFIDQLNKQCNLGFSAEQKNNVASKLGSDCSFFLNNKPVFAKGKGNEFSDIMVDLSAYYILVVYPNIHSNTKDAYSGITPAPAKKDLKTILQTTPVSKWKDELTNDFESTVFIKYPQIKKLKEDLYTSGALYACMSGSGSSVFGIFNKNPSLNFDPAYRFYLQTPAKKAL
ncbi:MAG: 4-(cytidine 5'-diphospho)-2-C-methyl-D-erythritol kinase [Bacteroidetes bacterium]|nr:4-(cytidine 5'-diphospho)-2-C-methyl-D-erythritol kinase [Bacteroidota bacterium]